MLPTKGVYRHRRYGEVTVTVCGIRGRQNMGADKTWRHTCPSGMSRKMNGMEEPGDAWIRPRRITRAERGTTWHDELHSPHRLGDTSIVIEGMGRST